MKPLSPNTVDFADQLAHGSHLRRLKTWETVRAEVLRRIRTGIWPEGALIPTEDELARELRCARATVNRALTELAEAGILERRRRVGTRVMRVPDGEMRHDLPLVRNEVEARGKSFEARLLSWEDREPPFAARTALHLTGGEHVVQSQSLFLADGKPWCHETRWLNLDVAPQITRDLAEREPMNEWIPMHLPITRRQAAIVARASSAVTAQVLGIEQGLPILSIERVAWVARQPVSFAVQHYLPSHRIATSY